MGILKVICVAYERVLPLQTLVNCFMVQTDPRWELHIIHDGPAPAAVRNVVFNVDSRILFYETPTRQGKYGHPNRRLMLQKIQATTDDYILITNDDNYYVPDFVRQFMAIGTNGTGMIYCDTLHNYFNYDVLKSQLRIGYIDMGAFVVRADVAKAVGFTSDEHVADGVYCEACAAYCSSNKLRILYIPKTLFVHN